MIPGKQVCSWLITKFSVQKKGESGFSYRFNLNVSLNFDKLLQIYIFYGGVSL